MTVTNIDIPSQITHCGQRQNCIHSNSWIL